MRPSRGCLRALLSVASLCSKIPAAAPCSKTPAAAAPTLDHICGLAENHILLHCLLRQLAQRGDVEIPEAATVRGDDDVAEGRVLGDLVDRDGGQVVVEPHPFFAPVQRDVEAELGAAEFLGKVLQ